MRSYSNLAVTTIALAIPGLSYMDVDLPFETMTAFQRLWWAHGESFDADPDYFMGEI